MNWFHYNSFDFNDFIDFYDIINREDLAIASLFGGISLANSKLGTIHGFAAVIGGMYDNAPHGAICATFLPLVFEKNAEKLQLLANSIETSTETSTASSTVTLNSNTNSILNSNLNSNYAIMKLQRFQEVSQIITGNSNATIKDGIYWLNSLVKDLEVPLLSKMCGMKASDIDEIALATSNASSTKGNPIELSIDELKEILYKLL